MARLPIVLAHFLEGVPLLGLLYRWRLAAGALYCMLPQYVAHYGQVSGSNSALVVWIAKCVPDVGPQSKLHIIVFMSVLVMTK